MLQPPRRVTQIPGHWTASAGPPGGKEQHADSIRGPALAGEGWRVTSLTANMPHHSLPEMGWGFALLREPSHPESQAVQTHGQADGGRPPRAITAPPSACRAGVPRKRGGSAASTAATRVGACPRYCRTAVGVGQPFPRQGRGQQTGHRNPDMDTFPEEVRVTAVWGLRLRAGRTGGRGLTRGHGVLVLHAAGIST